MFNMKKEDFIDLLYNTLKEDDVMKNHNIEFLYSYDIDISNNDGDYIVVFKDNRDINIYFRYLENIFRFSYDNGYYELKTYECCFISINIFVIAYLEFINIVEHINK